MMRRGADGEVKKRKSEKKSGSKAEKKKKKKKEGKKEKGIKKKKNRKGKKSKGEKGKGKLKNGKKKKRKNGKTRSGGKSKKKKKKGGKKNKKGKRKNKGKKRNKKKLKRKRNKMRGSKKSKKRRNKQKGNKLRQTTTAACSNLTCLTALVSVLKFEKDTVRNFLAQEKRTNSKLTLMQNKQNRSDKYMGTAKFLEKRLGETSAHKSDGPLCKGSYNTSEGIKVKMIENMKILVLMRGVLFQASEVAHWLEDCQTTIDTACAPHENINASQKELLKNCSDVMHAFKERSEKCQVHVNV